MIGIVGKSVTLEDYRTNQHYIDKKQISLTRRRAILIYPILPAEEKIKYIGIWEQRHKRYPQEYKRVICITLADKRKPDNINEQAEALFFWLVRQLAEREGVTEQLKGADQITWGKAMNSIYIERWKSCTIR